MPAWAILPLSSQTGDSLGPLEVSSSVTRTSLGDGELLITKPWAAWSGHVVPEARLGGPIALVNDGDRIIIDSEHRTIDWLVDEVEQGRRKQEWDASDKGQLTEKRGVLFRYSRDVAVSCTHSAMFLALNYLLQPASVGAYTD